MNYKLAFIGFGNVAKSLVHLLERKRAMLKSQYDITYSVTGISTGKHGCAVNPDGLDMNKVFALIENGGSIFLLSSFDVQDSLFVIQHSRNILCSAHFSFSSGSFCLLCLDKHLMLGLELGKF